MSEMSPHRCLVCGRPITWRFAICTECEKEFGRSAYQWPLWLRFLWADTQRIRRQNTQYLKREIALNDSDYNPWLKQERPARVYRHPGAE